MWYFIGGLAAGVMLFAAETMLAKIRGMKEGQRLLLEENERLHTQNRTLEDELAAWKKAAAEFGLTEDGKTPRRPEIPISQQWDNLGRYDGQPQKREEKG